ncbi:MAG: hypothetical protein HY757_00675 [Nitrospirae bacterium]|nr:hypothetical protein [Nitrospirota bacterium]
MKKTLILICMIVLFWLAGNSSATSPMPEEIKPGQTATVCTTHIVYLTEDEKGIHAEEFSSHFVFEAAGPKMNLRSNANSQYLNKRGELCQ